MGRWLSLCHRGKPDISTVLRKDKPMNCTRCEKGKLGKPYQSGNKWLSFCDTCGKNNGVKWSYDKNAGWLWEAYPIGRTSTGLIHTHRMEYEWSAGLSMDEFRRVLEAGKLAIDKRDNF